MFTGIIEALGQVEALQLRNREWQLRISSPALDFSDVALGDSIAINGVCLTVTEQSGQQFSADVSGETLRLTTLGQLQTGSKVNLEKALTPVKRLGGHIVSGHVDGMGELLDSQPEGGSICMTYRVPDELARYVAQKGSICIDGTSLTVNRVDGACFTVNIIPHTQAETIMHTYVKGQKVNLEVDVIARYLERLVLGEAAATPGKNNPDTGLTAAFLQEHGFAGNDR